MLKVSSLELMKIHRPPAMIKVSKEVPLVELLAVLPQELGFPILVVRVQARNISIGKLQVCKDPLVICIICTLILSILILSKIGFHLLGRLYLPCLRYPPLLILMEVNSKIKNCLPC